MRKLSCLLKPGGILYLGLPMGLDEVFWNAHRIYGPVRTPMMTAGWEVLGVYEGATKEPIDHRAMWKRWPSPLSRQPVIVLKNTKGLSCEAGRQ
jgi:Caenorhabditis protein of unknown function, DUF268